MQRAQTQAVFPYLVAFAVIYGTQTVVATGTPEATAAERSMENTPTEGTAQDNSNRVIPSFSLTQLRRFQDPGLSSAERLRGLLAYLRCEMQNPRLPKLGIGGGPIDSGYVQGVIVAKMGRLVTAEDLTRAVSKETSRAVADRLIVARGLAGDRSVIPRLIRILERHPEGFLRQKAAMALAGLKDPSTKAALHAALRDRYTRLSFPGVGPPRSCKIYPVRQAAAAGLRALGEQVPPEICTDVRQVADRPEAISWLFEDKQPDVCLSAVQILGRYGEEGLPYLKKFVEENQGNKTLKAALEAARSIIQAQEKSALPAPGG